MPSAFAFALPLLGAALPCLLLGAAHAAPVSAPVSAAAPDAPVPPTHYQPGLAYRAPPPASATPDQAWKEQNRIVAATDSMALTMAGHGQSHAGHGAAHAGHTPEQHAAHMAAQAKGAAQAKDAAHAGHHAAHGADPHAGHTPEQHAAHMAAQAQAAGHAAHAAPAAPAAPAADPHAAHRTPPAAQDHGAHGSRGAPAGKPASTTPAAGHQHEGHH